MTLADIGNALLAVHPETHHYSAPPGTHSPYIVWAEDGQADAVWADDGMTEQALTGTVHLFTKTEYDPLFGKIQSALNALGVSWRMGSIQYEDDTGYIHYEWIWEAEIFWQ